MLNIKECIFRSISKWMKQTRAHNRSATHVLKDQEQFLEKHLEKLEGMKSTVESLKNNSK